MQPQAGRRQPKPKQYEHLLANTITIASLDFSYRQHRHCRRLSSSSIPTSSDNIVISIDFVIVIPIATATAKRV
jgi:hypothetical protein